MPSINNFGITAAILAAEVFGLELSDTEGAETQPTATQFATILKRVTGEANALFRDLTGNDPDAVTDANTEHYQLMAGIIAARGKAELWLARSPDQEGREQARYWDERADAKIETLRKYRGSLGEGRNTSAGAPGRMQTSIERRAQAALQTANLPIAERTIRGGKM